MDEQLLFAAGVDYREGLARFSNKAALYEKHLVKILADPSFKELGEVLAQKDYEAAFRIAHALKGITGNLSMNAAYRAISELVDAMRGPAPEEGLVEGLFESARQKYETACKAIAATVPRE